jgi:trimeric autotransporter adhesin
MKTKILSGLICCLGIFSAKAQTITAPIGTPLTITNAVDVTLAGGSVNVPADGSYNLGATKVLSIKGTNNLFVGPNTGPLNTAANNVFVGGSAGQSNTTGTGNLFFGGYAGNLNTTGNSNLFFGVSAGEQNTTGYGNMFVGSGAGVGSTTGLNNLFLGTTAGRLNGSGNANIFIGSSCGFNSANVDGNTFMGTSAAYNNTGGTSNSGIGQNAGYTNTTGSQNTFIGYSAGFALPSGTLNTFIGASSDIGVGAPVGITNATAIGGNSRVTASNTVVLGQAATTITGTGLAAGQSGLKFANLTSGSATTSVPGGKVLGVDGTGNVVLVALSGATTTSVGQPVSDNWKEADGYLYNNSTNGVVIKGTGLDGNSLIVKGGVLSKEVNVKVEGSESWPDYVFQPSYKRMSLDEVEKFITVNKHLPNVPSAAEMAITGNNLGKTDVKLLEKVEELTLYLLEMKKTNDAQSAELQSLKNQMNKLKKNRK